MISSEKNFVFDVEKYYGVLHASLFFCELTE